MQLTAVPVFLFFLSMSLAVWFYRKPPLSLGDKLGLKKPVKVKARREAALLGKMRYFDGLSRSAATSGVLLSPGQIAYPALLAAAIGLIVSFVVFRSIGFALAAAALLFFVYPRWHIWRMTNAHKKTITMQLAGALLSMTAALRAGRTLIDAVGSAAADTPAPLGTELQKAYDSVRHGGEDLPTALEKMLARTGNHYIVEKLVLAVNLTRQAGGNIAAALEGVAEMVDNERYTLEFASSRASHGRMVAVVFNIILLAVSLNMMRLMPGAFTQTFLADFQGRVILFVSIAAVIFGWYLIHRLLSSAFED